MNKITLELKSLRQLAERLQSAWVNGDWKAETVNEREMEKLMTELGYWPAKIDPNTWELVKPKYDEMKMYSHKQFNRLLDENEYNDLPELVKQQYEFYGVVTNNGGGEKMVIDMSNNPGTINNTDEKMTGGNKSNNTNTTGNISDNMWTKTLTNDRIMFEADLWNKTVNWDKNNNVNRVTDGIPAPWDKDNMVNDEEQVPYNIKSNVVTSGKTDDGTIAVIEITIDIKQR